MPKKIGLKCKAIAKSTKERCKNLAVKGGYCKLHQPDGLTPELLDKLKAGALGTVIIKNLSDLLGNISFFLKKDNKHELQTVLYELDKLFDLAHNSGMLSTAEKNALVFATRRNALRVSNQYAAALKLEKSSQRKQKKSVVKRKQQKRA